MPQVLPSGARVWALLLVPFFIVAGCGSGGPTDSGAGGLSGGGGEGGTRSPGAMVVEIPPTAPLSAEAAYDAIKAIEATIASALPPSSTPEAQRDREVELRSVAQALVDSPEVVSVFVDSTALAATIVLVDASTTLFVNNRFPDTDSPMTGQKARLAPLLQPKSAPQAATVSGSEKAVVFAIEGGEELADNLVAMVTGSGYQVSRGGSLSAMRNYKDLGFLYMDTHGGLLLRVQRIPNEKGEVHRFRTNGVTYSLATTTEITRDNWVQLLPEFNDGEIAVAHIPGDTGVSTKISITDKFIEANWALDNAAAIVHSCYSGSSEIPDILPETCFGLCPGDSETYDSTSMRDAIIAAGADALMTFDNLTHPRSAADSISYFVDRLLGANRHEPVDPEQRPFDWAQIEPEMRERGLMSFWHGPFPVDVIIDTGDDSPALAPSIMNMNVVDDVPVGNSRLEIFGIFGAETGKAELDGFQLEVDFWTPDRIVAQLPVENPGAGEVIAIGPGQIESNPVPLTEWRGSLTYTINSLGLVSKGVGDLRFRADVHKFREGHEEDPMERVVETYLSPASEGRSEGSGSFSDPETGFTATYSGGASMTLLNKVGVDLLASGASAQALTAGELGPPISGFDAESELGGIVTFDPKNDSARICLWMLGFHDSSSNGMSFPDSVFVSLVGTPFPLSFRGQLACLDLTLDDNYRIGGGSFEHKETSELGDVTWRLEWTDFDPVSPPDADTPG